MMRGSRSCLRQCAEQVAPIFSHILNQSLELCIVRSSFKCSIITPVSKKPSITGLNENRPVTLMSVVMRSSERLVDNHLIGITCVLLDPCSLSTMLVDDGVLLGLHYILHHRHYHWYTGEDFNLVFNTIVPAILHPCHSACLHLDHQNLESTKDYGDDNGLQQKPPYSSALENPQQHRGTFGTWFLRSTMSWNGFPTWILSRKGFRANHIAANP